MPINNALNKRSDTFLATTNITANFTSPRLTTTTNTGTYSNAVSVLSTSASNVGISCEYISNTTTLGARLFLSTARGTPAAPANITGNDNILGEIIFAAFESGVYTEQAKITGYGLRSRLEFTAGSVIWGLMSGSGATDRQMYSNSQVVYSQEGPTTFNTINVSGFASASSGFIQSRTSASITNTTNFIGLSHQNYSTSNIGASLVLLRSRNTTPGLSTKVESGDEIGQIVFVGADGTSTAKQMGWIKCFADGATGSSDVPGRLTFATTPDGTATPSEAMNINNSGCITQIRQPSFSASLSADVANATGDGTAYTVAFNTEQYDQGSNFAANTFTAPVTGKYRFNYILSVDDLAVGHTKLELTIGGRTVERCNPYALADSDGFALFAGSVDLSLTASATVTMVVTVSGSTKTVTVKGTTSSGTFLSGQLQV